eukprot:scaffold29382_cov27-Tisochrysis_lutea.AAC.1
MQCVTALLLQPLSEASAISKLHDPQQEVAPLLLHDHSCKRVTPTTHDRHADKGPYLGCTGPCVCHAAIVKECADPCNDRR